MRTPRRAFSLSIGIVFGLALAVAPLIVAGDSLVFWEHYECATGTLLASQFNWTPELFENAPYGGSVFAKASFEGGWISGEVLNGTAALFFGQSEWNLTSVDRVLVSGPGPNQQCPPYEVTSGNELAPWQQSGGCGGCRLLGPGNVSDAGVPTQFNISIWGPGVGLTSVIFHDAFVEDNDGSVSTCGRPATQVNLTSPNLDFQIPFETSNGRVSVDSTQYNVGPNTLPGFLMNFTYDFPANFGVWEIDNLTLGPDPPGSGLAFSYSPCPS